MLSWIMKNKDEIKKDAPVKEKDIQESEDVEAELGGTSCRHVFEGVCQLTGIIVQAEIPCHCSQLESNTTE